jgi:hypothetical protein
VTELGHHDVDFVEGGEVRRRVLRQEKIFRDPLSAGGGSSWACARAPKAHSARIAAAVAARGNRFIDP